MLMVVGSLSSGAALRSGPRRPFTARPPLPPRRHCRPFPAACRRTVVAAMAVDGSQLLSLAANAGGKLTKTAVGRLSVGELRAECQQLQLPSDGLKAALVERLMEWWDQEGRQTLQQGEQQGQQAAEAAVHEAPAAPAPPAEGSGAVHPVEPQQLQQRAHPLQLRQREHEQDAQQAQQRKQAVGPGGPISVTWLGTSSGNPTPRRNVSAIAVQADQALYLVDCGEGTRNQLRRTRLPLSQIRALLVTHMHGDHCFGVPGVLATAMEARRGTPLQGEPLLLYGPPELQSLVLASVRAGDLTLTAPVLVTGFVLDPARARPPTKVDESGLLQFALQAPDQADRVPPHLGKSWQAAYDQGSENIVQRGLTWTVRVPGSLTVSAAQLQHRVPCWGYVFQEPAAPVPPPHPADRAQHASAGGDMAADEEQQWVRRGRKLVILGDTCDSTSIGPLAAGCDLLSHEATFCSGMEEKAAIAQHSTTLQAGAFAAAVDAQRLVLTHFSARYESGGAWRQGGQRGRGGGGSAGGDATDDLRRSDLEQLLEETHSTYGKDSLELAHDFFTADVALPPPMPVAQLQAQQAQQAAAVAQAMASGAPARQPHSQQQQYGQRRTGGSDRQQYGQRRPGGGGGRGGGRYGRSGGGRGGGQYDQRRRHGGNDGGEQQQRQRWQRSEE